ncbi:MAG: type II toxin-antitoxin system Phd/YefM family antitoxin [Ignavibacteria bacterium]|nr:type II toxin-antitoxin system Phd/YefM family antitoxin [Ignavibacteria bacterium]
MSKIPSIIPISDLRQDASAVVREVASTGEPYVITQRGRATAVLVSIEAFEKTETENTLLRLLARGQREIEAGQGHRLASVLAEADALLGADA